ncbi:MAG: hypothetical protein RLZZ299_3105 [Pseudomonadota bacterium]
MDAVRTPGSNALRVTLVVVSLAAHLLVARTLQPWSARPPTVVPPAPVRVRMTDADALDAMTPTQRAALRRLEAALAPPERRPDPPDEAPPPPPPRRGQVVETPKPKRTRTPDRADHLAEHDNAVPEETRTERTRVNPEVVAERYRDETRRPLERLLDVGVTNPVTGATPGGTRGPGAGTPGRGAGSERAATEREGTRTPSDGSTQEGSGAPQNDRLAVRRGDVVALNTRAFAGAAYINRIKRQVNVYWNQQLDNLPADTRLAAPRYETVVDLLLDGKGGLLAVQIAHASGSDALDACVLRAFERAAPFPNPPPQLIGPDGRIALPDLSFEVVLGGPAGAYRGIDPRAGVQFPGIQKAPR